MLGDSFVYFLQVDGGGPIKIGVSVEPITRLRSLMSWCPYPLSIIAKAPGCRIAEAAVQHKFADACIHGEWFHPTRDLRAFIERVCATGMLDADIPNTVLSGLGKRQSRRSRLGDVLGAAGLSFRNVALAIGAPTATAGHWRYWLPEHRAVQIADFLTARGFPTSPFDLYADAA